ncbi:TPA: hypothetical protein JHK27_003068 [Serratia marcescens]|uniref:phosphoribosyltransferase n=1 Tax=Serratia marcescens TaxID=615 RepID=UPI000F7F4C1A|nr:phosphoribosyltransferase [Serratia marcescens]MDH2267705.1 phosphoribosyltransferase [Serratia marcescens]MDH2275682.1 phosphoribosyltransferase [Serratia marcescens]HAV2277468.1 hypothetical protein [Serratia marcescens]HCR3024972.1 hypothetical protein [Serratia marcescens]
MGVDVSHNRIVTFNAEHDHRVVTSIDKNPKIKRIGKNPKVTVFSIYRRTKTGDYERDGNPLIYALKGLHRYTITNADLYRFRPSFYAILTNTVAKVTQGPRVVLVMPSSSPLVFQFARKVARGLGCELIKNAFSKRTAGEMLSDFELAKPMIKQSHKSDVHKVIAELTKAPVNSIFSMKHVPNRVREYFCPLKMNPQFDVTVLQEIEVILVDDLLSTGTTLVSAANELSRFNVSCTQSVCLLSDLS